MKKMYIILNEGLVDYVVSNVDEETQIIVVDRDLPDQMSKAELDEYEALEDQLDKDLASGDFRTSRWVDNKEIV